MTELSIFQMSGFGGLLILALDLLAIISVLGSSARTGRKVLWVLLILVLPVLGFLLWALFGPRADTRVI